MRRPGILILLLVAAPAVVRAEPSQPASKPATLAGPIDFRRDVYPILSERCFECHKGADADSGYRLDQRDELLGYSDGRAAVEIGHGDRSRLIELVSGRVADKRMPPEDSGNPLSPVQIATLRRWIDEGLKWDDALLPPAKVKSDHWAFQPVVRPALPAVAGGWARNAVDAFVAGEHRARGLRPSEEASRRDLARRLWFDLLGLPPSVEEVNAFIADHSPDAYEKLVERLLVSPHYGERWGRHWLDLARWADTEGYEENYPRPFAWRYRDYVVSSFNADKPYDRFLREQIAGDELQPYSDENLIATGFLASARLSSNDEDLSRQRSEALIDIVNATSSTVLGLTIGCAQCHNHKFDPISQRDYYQLEGFFAKGQLVNAALKDKQLWAEYSAAKPADYDRMEAERREIFERSAKELVAKLQAKLPAETRAALAALPAERTPEQERLVQLARLVIHPPPDAIEKAIPPAEFKRYKELRDKLAEYRKKMPVPPQTLAFYSPMSASSVDVLPMKAVFPLPYDALDLKRTEARLLVRGDIHNPGAVVGTAWPAVFGTPPAAESIRSAPRTALVDWLVERRNPLTARVWANRVWYYHFGRGLVDPPSDFGLRGARPTHPALLDYLASELVDSGWSTKHLHRLIVLSSTYRQASRYDAVCAKADPDNLYLWHWQPRRLEAEAIRDATLKVSGRLNLALGGPSVPLDQAPPAERRTVYLMQDRNALPDVQVAFDAPGATESCARRAVSTVPLQPLYLLNHPFMVAQAKALADRVAASGKDHAAQVDAAFRYVLSRAPDDAERKAGTQFLDTKTGEDASRRLMHFCHAMLNLNEFFYVD